MIIDGKQIAQDIAQKLKEQISQLSTPPKLQIILIGENPASLIYVNQKKKKGEEIGIDVEVTKFDQKVEEEKVVEEIGRANGDLNIDGVIIQLPLPAHLDKEKLLNLIAKNKDVDGLSTDSPFKPATPLGIMELLIRSKVEISGKKVVVMGASDLVGKPVARLLEDKGGQVSIVDINTPDPRPIIKSADILVVAIGNAKYVKKEMVKEGVVVIDVGTNRTDAGLVGDVDFNEVEKVASLITPVPGGVGPMTVVMLLSNVIKAKLARQG